MKKLILLLCISFSIIQLGFSQTSILQSSAINEGLGHTSATLSNYASIFTNVAGLADINATSFAASYRIIPNAFWQNTVSVSGTLPTKIGTAGLGFSRLGDDIYNQQIVSAGFANRYGIASIGVKASLLQYNIEGLASKSIPYFEIGGIAELTPQLYIGAYIVNVTQTKLASFENEHFPTIIDAGLSYRPSEKLMINIEVEQDIDHSPTFKAGMDYKPIKNLSLRTGINTSPNRQYFGLGFIPNNISLNIDYSLSHDNYWGITHQMSIFFALKKASE